MDRPGYDDVVRAAKERLGEAAFAAAWEAGTRLPPTRPSMKRSAWPPAAMRLLRPHLPRQLRPTTETEQLPDGTRMSLAGLVVVRQRPETAKGVTFLLLEDELGLLNVIVPPPLYERERHIVRTEPFVVIAGMLQKQLNTINLLAERIWILNEARQLFRMPEAAGRAAVRDRRVPVASHDFR